jgi:hypothetical protein
LISVPFGGLYILVFLTQVNLYIPVAYRLKPYGWGGGVGHDIRHDDVRINLTTWGLSRASRCNGVAVETLVCMTMSRSEGAELEEA